MLKPGSTTTSTDTTTHPQASVKATAVGNTIQHYRFLEQITQRRSHLQHSPAGTIENLEAFNGKRNDGLSGQSQSHTMLQKPTSQERAHQSKAQSKWLNSNQNQQQNSQQKEEKTSNEFTAANQAHMLRQSQNDLQMSEKRTGTSMFTTRYNKVLHQSIQLQSEPSQKMHATANSSSMPFPKSNSLQYSQQQKKTLSKKLQGRIGQFAANALDKQQERSELGARSSRLGRPDNSHSCEAERAVREQRDKQALYDFLQRFTGQNERVTSGEQDLPNLQDSSRLAPPALLSSVHALSQKSNAPVIRQLPTSLYKGIISSMKRKRLSKVNPTRFGSSGSRAESHRGQGSATSQQEEYYGGEDNVNCLPNETASSIFRSQQFNQYSPDPHKQSQQQYGDDYPVAMQALEQMRQSSMLLYTDHSQQNPHYQSKHIKDPPSHLQSLDDLEERFQQECDDLMGSISADPHDTIPELDSVLNTQSVISFLGPPQDTLYQHFSKESSTELADQVCSMTNLMESRLSNTGVRDAGVDQTRMFTQAWVQQPAQIPMAKLFESNQGTTALHSSLVFNDQSPSGTIKSSHNKPASKQVLRQHQQRSTVQGFNASMQVRNSMRVKGLAPPQDPTSQMPQLVPDANKAQVQGPALSHRRFNSNPYSSTSPKRAKALNQNVFQTSSSNSMANSQTRQSKLLQASNCKTHKYTEKNPFSISISSTTQQRANIASANDNTQIVQPTHNQILEYYKRNHEFASTKRQSLPPPSSVPKSMAQTSRQRNSQQLTHNKSQVQSPTASANHSLSQQQNQFPPQQKQKQNSLVACHKSSKLSAGVRAQSPPSIQ